MTERIKIPTRKVSQKVKRPAPAGWRDVRSRMRAVMLAPVAEMLGMLKPGGRMPRPTNERKSK